VLKIAQKIKHDGCVNVIVEIFIVSEVENFEAATLLLVAVEKVVGADSNTDTPRKRTNTRFTKHGKLCINDATTQIQKDTKTTAVVA
jgi:hypothetical protein